MVSPGYITFRQKPNESQSGDDEAACFISTFCVSMDSGAINTGLITQEFDHFLCIFITVFPLRIPETVIKYRNN